MRRVLLTRPEGDNAPLAAALAAAGAEAMEAPLLREVPLAPALPDPSGYAGVILTSRRAPHALVRLGAPEGYFALPAHVVGEATAEAARACGFTELHVAEGTGADLARRIAAAPPQGRLFYAGARERSPDLEAGLKAAEIGVDTYAVYGMDPAEALPQQVSDALAGGQIAGTAFYSRRTATVFAQLVSAKRFDTMRRALVCLCLSEACAEPLRAAGFTDLRVSAHPEGPAMAALVLGFAAGELGE